MKKLLLILFIPIISFSQTFEELSIINSLDDFKKVMIENGYEFDSLDNSGGVTDGLLSYGYDMTEYSSGSSGSSRWMYYWTNDDRGFHLMFVMKNHVTGLDDPRLESNKNNYYTTFNRFSYLPYH